MPAGERDETKVVGQNLRLPLGVHQQLRKAAFDREIPMQEIYRQALNLWFAKEGLRSWEEATKRGKR
jgi:hypothetical protein